MFDPPFLDDLPGCREKLRRAVDHMKLLQSEIQGFTDDFTPGNAYRFRKHPDPDTGSYTLRIEVLKAPPLLRWGAIVGDAVHNLRSCLDHLIEALTVAHSGTALTRTEFPIFEHEHGVPGSGPGFKDMKRKGGGPVPGSGYYKIRGIDPALWTPIEALQPYQRQGDPQSHVLFILHDLDIVDKHRLIPVVAFVTRISAFSFSGLSGSIVFDYMDSAEVGTPFIFEDEATIPGLMFGADSDPGVEVEFEMVFDVGLDQAGPGADYFATRFISEAIWCVGCICSYFEPFIK
jgi:hypothetical protein